MCAVVVAELATAAACKREQRGLLTLLRHLKSQNQCLVTADTAAICFLSEYFLQQL